MSLQEELTVDRIKHLIGQLNEAIPQLDQLREVSEQRKQEIQDQIANYSLSIRSTKIDQEQLESFFKKPYHLLPTSQKRDETSYYLIMPRFMDVQFGWLHQQTPSYNVFLINRYVEWLGDLPNEIKKQLGWKSPPGLTMEGEFLKGSPEGLRHAWEHYRPQLLHMDKDKIKINPKRTFELLAQMIKDGILPFIPKPVSPEDHIPPVVDFQLRDYQKEALEQFWQYSNIGVFYPASVGKTYLAMYALASLKGPHLVVVPSLILKEQWEERILVHLSPEQAKQITVTTYQSAVKKHGNTQWGLLVIDEVHHLPSDQFSKLALLKRKYGMGLTASPQREDTREYLIFALTGKPVGLGWEYFKKMGIISSPVCNVHIVKNQEAKLSLLDTQLREFKKTVIFCDGLDLGKRISTKYNIPHISGETKDNRMKTVVEALNKEPFAVVVSRVGDEGMSLPDLERIIEVDWLYGSRRQELQRFTRLLHGEKGEEHHILMTMEEHALDKKRLYSIMDKGFDVKIITDDETKRRISRGEFPSQTRRIKQVSSSTITSLTPITPLSGGQDKAILSMPGIQKIMSGLKPKQKSLMEYLLQNDSQWFKKSSLMLILGCSTDSSWKQSVKPMDLVNKRLVEKQFQGGESAFRTNLRAKGIGG